MLTRWTSHLEATKSLVTAHEYTAAVRLFSQFCVERGYLSMNTETLQEYVNTISRTLAPRTVHLRVIAIREYMRFCGYELGKIALPSIPRSEPRHLNDDQLATFFEHCQRVKNPAVRAVLKLLPLTGLRIREEMLKLTSSCIERDREGAWIRVTGKRKRVRQVPLVQGAEAVLMEYMNRHRDEDGDAPGEPIFKVQYRTVYNQLVKIREAMGLPWLHPHILRHTFATRLRENDVPLADIGDLLGHSNLSTTAMYAHSTEKTRRRAVQRGLDAVADFEP